MININDVDPFTRLNFGPIHCIRSESLLWPSVKNAFAYIVERGNEKSDEFYNSCWDWPPKSGNPFVLTRVELYRDLKSMKRLPKWCIDIDESSICQKVGFMATIRRMAFGYPHAEALRLTLLNTLGVAWDAAEDLNRYGKCHVVMEF